jgi:hypothetical protein
MALPDGISAEVRSTRSTAMLQKISERIKGRLARGPTVRSPNALSL